MTTPAESPASPTIAARKARFRVQDNARALWLVMAGLLLSGFLALRMLIGAADTPRVDNATAGEAVDPLPSVEMPTDEVHRLRPQTTATLPSVERLDSEALLSTESDGWNHLPAATWEPLPLAAPDADAEESGELARQPELFR